MNIQASRDLCHGPLVVTLVTVNTSSCQCNAQQQYSMHVVSIVHVGQTILLRLLLWHRQPPDGPPNQSSKASISFKVVQSQLKMMLHLA